MVSLRRALAALAIVVGAVLVLAGPASAHASLESSDPANGAVLTESPAQISLRFDEAVEIALGAVRLYDGTGHEVDVGTAHHPSGEDSQVVVSTHDLSDGLSVVSWRVVWADSRPVTDAFRYQAGPATFQRAPSLLPGVLSRGGGNPAAGAVLGVARFV